MLPKVELNKIRKLGEVIDDSILFFKQNWKPLLKSYFIICGFFWAAGLVLAVFNQTETFRLQEAGESVYSITFFLTGLFTFINFTFMALTALSFVALYHDKGNQAPTVEEVWAYVKYYIIRVFSSSVLLLAMVGAGTLICVLPGIYLAPISLFIIVVMVLENASLNYSFSAGFRLIKGSWWNLFGMLLVMGVLLMSATLLLAIPVIMIVTALLYLTSLNHSHTILLAVVLTASALQFLYLLPVIGMAFSYYDLSLRNNDSSLLQRIEMIGKTIENDKQLPLEEY